MITTLALLIAVGLPAPPALPPVVYEPCPWVESVGCTSPGKPIYMDPDWASRELLRHELGHQFDYQVMDDTERDGFRALIGDPRPWRAEGGNSPHEQFAEAYSLCVVRRARVYHLRNGGYGYAPRWRTHKRVCALIKASA